MTTHSESVVERPSAGLDSAQKISRNLLLARRSLLPFLLVVELIVFTLSSNSFLTVGNFLNIASDATEVALIGAGMTLVILMGGIDISTGYAMGVIAWLVAYLNGVQTNPVLILVAAVAVGALVGLINGQLVAIFKIPSIVATLGMSAILQTVLFTLWDKTDIFSGPILEGLSRQSKFFGIPTLVLITVALYLVLYWVTQKTVFGRSMFAIGSNREAATLAGIRTNIVRIAAFVIVGVTVALAAVTYVGRVGVVQASTGGSITLLAIAAVVVGGTSILGGEGSVLRTLGGVAFIMILQNGVVLAGVPPLWNGLMIGVVILLAVLLDGIISRLNSDQQGSLA